MGTPAITIQVLLCYKIFGLETASSMFIKGVLNFGLKQVAPVFGITGKHGIGTTGNTLHRSQINIAKGDFALTGRLHRHVGPEAMGIGPVSGDSRFPRQSIQIKIGYPRILGKQRIPTFLLIGLSIIPGKIEIS